MWAWHACLTKETPRLRAKAYALLRPIMASAVDDELIAAAPLGICGAGVAAVMHPVEPAMPAETQVMTDNMPPLLSAALIIVHSCDLRRGEIAKLRRRDIDGANHQIEVRGAITFPAGGAVVGPRNRTPACVTSRFPRMCHAGARLAAKVGAITTGLQARLGHSASEAARILTSTPRRITTAGSPSVSRGSWEE